MVNLARRAALVTVALAVALLTAGPAMASTPPASPSPTASPTGYACLNQEGGYAASGVCQLVVLKADTVCRGNLPYLDYSLQALGTPVTTATLTWGNPNGQHVTMTGLPLTGSVLWPGAVADAQGNAIDWPGWTLVNGVWVQHDQWDWVRPSVPVTFEVNPSATITAHYPEETAPCADPVSTAVLADSGSAVLASTGTSDATPLMFGAAGALLLGALLLALRAAARRRSASR